MQVGGNGVSMFRIPPKSNQFKTDEWVKSLQLNEADHVALESINNSTNDF